MKAILSVGIVTDTPSSLFKIAQLEVEIAFTPSLDISFAHPAFKEERKPQRISYNIEEETLYIELVEQSTGDVTEAEMYADAFASHGWILLG